MTGPRRGVQEPFRRGAPRGPFPQGLHPPPTWSDPPPEWEAQQTRTKEARVIHTDIKTNAATLAAEIVAGVAKVLFATFEAQEIRLDAVARAAFAKMHPGRR